MERNTFLDFLKGIAIFLVVLGHAYLLCMGRRTEVFELLTRFHMPFWFMLSGFMAYRLKERNWLISIKKKGVSLLIPFISCGSFYAFTFDAFDRYLFDAFHAGYWFLLSLFICWVFFIPFLKLSELLPNKLNGRGRICLLFVILMTPFFIGKIFEEIIGGNLFLGMSLSYYRFLVLGYFIGEFLRVPSKARSVLQKDNYSALGVLCFILFIVTTICYFKHVEWIETVPFTLMQIVLCISFMGFIYCYKLYMKPSLCSLVELVGRKSLVIYCFHYFIIYPIRLESVETLQNTSEGVLFLAAFSLSVVVIVLTLFVASPIENNKYLKLIFLGKGIK